MRTISLLFIVMLLIFSSQVHPMDRESIVDEGYVAGQAGKSRCVLCDFRRNSVEGPAGNCSAAENFPDPETDNRIVWCNGYAEYITIYPSLSKVLAYRQHGHCLHLPCFAIWVKTKNHCPVCYKVFSAREKAAFYALEYFDDEEDDPNA
jgi:hypothetical protein